MDNAYRAVRQLERLFLSRGGYPREASEQRKLIATIIYSPDRGEVRIERPEPEHEK